MGAIELLVGALIGCAVVLAVAPWVAFGFVGLYMRYFAWVHRRFN